MSFMFFNCQSLTSIDVSSFDTSKANTIYNMFTNCISLKSINISNFDTKKSMI